MKSAHDITEAQLRTEALAHRAHAERCAAAFAHIGIVEHDILTDGPLALLVHHVGETSELFDHPAEVALALKVGLLQPEGGRDPALRIADFQPVPLVLAEHHAVGFVLEFSIDPDQCIAVRMDAISPGERHFDVGLDCHFFTVCGVGDFGGGHAQLDRAIRHAFDPAAARGILVAGLINADRCHRDLLLDDGKLFGLIDRGITREENVCV